MRPSAFEGLVYLRYPVVGVRPNPPIPAPTSRDALCMQIRMRTPPREGTREWEWEPSLAELVPGKEESEKSYRSKIS